MKQASNTFHSPHYPFDQINSETDFVPRNDLFKSLVSNAAAAALSLDVGAGPAAQSVEAAAVLSATGPAGGQRSVGDRVGI